MGEHVMRAKMVVSAVEAGTAQERVHFYAVAKSDGYPTDGADEDNTYAKFSPAADLHITIANPALFGKHALGDRFYVDFTRADK